MEELRSAASSYQSVRRPLNPYLKVKRLPLETRVSANREIHIKFHNHKTNLIESNFMVGDFRVLQKSPEQGI